ncbi:3-isopropylmalate dehydratase large subunit [Zavarzinia sp.]|uniref:3-isopropylmalate dehydratase large subunit n=1 Tax=Zavarzinia sp. TaxID=2027920 RepID=UPI0035618561
MMPATLIDKIWCQHAVREFGDGWTLLAIDRQLIHDLSGPPALKALTARGVPVHSPDLVFATPDHVVSSEPGRTGETMGPGAGLWRELRQRTGAAGIRLFDVGERGQGIVHVIGPELGLVLPGATLVCGDSHTCTNGALGALAFGVGTSECAHALGTATLRMRKPRKMRLTIEGRLGRGVTAKDVILHAIAVFGTSAAVQHVIEYAGSTVRALDIEERLTLCNLSVEMGARSGIVAPDDKTFDYLAGRRNAPGGALFERAVDHWRRLASDEGAVFDTDVALDARAIAPTLTWGTDPGQAMPVDGLIPDPREIGDPAARQRAEAALAYMGLAGGQPLAGAAVDIVFIGSCANARLSDLRAAAAILRGRRVATGVTAWAVPGSEQVKRDAEAEGLDRVFRDAGFQWREPGCSLCVAANGDVAPPGARVVSTSNRNFVGRQGPGARTHLASPASAAAAAVAGRIVDVRSF